MLRLWNDRSLARFVRLPCHNLKSCKGLQVELMGVSLEAWNFANEQCCVHNAGCEQ